MTPDRTSTPVRRRRIAGERSRPAERPAEQTAPKPAPKGGGPRRPRPPRTAGGWRPSRRTLAWFVPLCVLAFVAAGLAIGLGVLQTRDDGLDAAARQDAVAPAGQAAEALLSFRYDTLDQELPSERDLMTDSYAEEFLNVFPDQARRLTAKQQATVKSTVLAAAPMECGEDCSSDRVDVLVYLNSESSVRGQAPEVNPNRAVMTMSHEGDRWLVDGIELF
jgi:Mce-associated membrane protein